MKSFLKVFRLVIAFIFVWPIFPMAFIGLIFYYLFYILHLKKVAIAVSRSLMVATVMNILGHLYWEKTAKIKLPKLMEEVDSLYDSIESGVISINELIQDTAEMGNLKSKYFDILKNDKDMWDKINWGEVK